MSAEVGLLGASRRPRICNESPIELLRWSRTRYDKLRRALPGLQFVEQVRQGNRPDVLRHVEGVLARVNDEEPLKFQVR